MIQVEIVVREVGRTKPEYSLAFELPQIPNVGDYISIRRLDVREPLGEDLIVRHVWWRLHHSGEPFSLGAVTEIFVECDQAIGPYSTASWRATLETKKNAGANVEVFEVDRMPVFGQPDQDCSE
jgi:hypothetical protein